MEDIPDDVVALILAKLEVREIAKNRKVNRLMRSIIDQDNLIEKSLEPYLEILDLNGLIEFDKQNVYNKSYILEFEEDENVLNFKLSNVSKYTKNWDKTLIINKYSHKYKIYQTNKNENNVLLFISIEDKLYIFGESPDDHSINIEINLVRDMEKIFFVDDHNAIYVIYRNKYVKMIELEDIEKVKQSKNPYNCINGYYKYFNDKFLIYFNETEDEFEVDGSFIYFHNRIILELFYYIKGEGWKNYYYFQDIIEDINDNNLNKKTQEFINDLNLMTELNNYDKDVIQTYYQFLSSYLATIFN